jgi:ABC-type glycerol-3-phosphate transport system substrate-binding protein
MKFILKLTFFILVILFGCTGSKSKNQDTTNQLGNTTLKTQNNKAVLNVIGHWMKEGKKGNLVREWANEFEFLNQEYAINLVFPEQLYWDPNDRAYCEAKFLKNVLKADTQKWDILRINGDYLNIAEIMKDPEWPKKYLVDFSEIPEFKKYTLPGLLSDSIKHFWRGIIPGPFLEGFNWSVWFNKELAKEIGINVKQYGMTAEDFIGYVKAIDSYNKKNNKHIYPIFHCNSWSTIYALGLQLYISEAGYSNDDSYTERKLEAWHKTLKFFEEIAKANAYNYDWKKFSWDESWDYPLTKKCFFYINASWMYAIWEKVDINLVQNMIPAELPTFKTPNIYMGGYQVTWAVPKNAPHREEAIKYLLFLNKPDYAEKWARYTKCPTGILGSVSSSALGMDHFEEFNYYIEKKYGLRKFNFIDDAEPILGNSRKKIKIFMPEVAFGQMTADEAMAEIRKELKNFTH